MGKYFNVDGVCRAKEHFMMDVSERANTICKMVDNGDFFCVNSGRLFGKSTLLRVVADMLSDKYLVFRISLKGIDEKVLEEEEKFYAKILDLICKSCIWTHNPGLGKKLKYFFDCDDYISLCYLDYYLKELSQLNYITKPIVLIIDDIDNVCNYQSLIDFLKLINSIFLERNSYEKFQSIIVGSNFNIKDFYVNWGTSKYYPLNVFSSVCEDCVFTVAEIAGMLSEFKSNNKLTFEEKTVSESIYAYTLGQPFLVSSLCKIIVDQKLSWNEIGVETAVDIFIEGANPYFDNLVSDLRYYPELNVLLRSVIVDDSEIDFEASNKCIRIASMLKYIIDKNGKVCIANKILDEFLYDYFLGDSNPYQVDGAVKFSSNNPVIKLALDQLQDTNEILVTSSLKKNLSRTELVERLKAIAEDETPREEHFGAMCYSPMTNPIKIRFECNFCGGNIYVRDEEDYKNIFLVVDAIKSLGYDAKVAIICEDCAKSFAEKNNFTIKSSYSDDFDLKKDIDLKHLNFVFYFRLSDDSVYHCVIDNEIYHYISLLSFLGNEKMYFGRYDESHYLADEIKALEFMTGLKLNE